MLLDELELFDELLSEALESEDFALSSVFLIMTMMTSITIATTIIMMIVCVLGSIFPHATFIPSILAKLLGGATS